MRKLFLYSKYALTRDVIIPQTDTDKYPVSHRIFLRMKTDYLEKELVKTIVTITKFITSSEAISDKSYKKRWKEC